MTKKTMRLAKTTADYQRLSLTPGKIQEFEDGLRTSGQKGEFEWWYYDAKLDGGATLVVTFFSNNATDTQGGFHPSVKIELTQADGRKVEDRVSYDPTEARFDRDRCAVQIGPNRFEGDLHHYRIEVRAPKIVAEIDLTGTVNPWRTATGHI